MNVEATQTGKIEYRFGKQLSVSSDYYGVGLQGSQFGLRFVRTKTSGLYDRKSSVYGIVLDRRRLGFASPA